jgi:hypothetical protein
MLLLAAAALTPPAHAATTVYSNDFENAAGAAAATGKEWSQAKIEQTPNGNRHFLGGFTTDNVTLKLERLPKHAFIRVSLDLYLIGMWDGNAQGESDGWRMCVEGGATLVDATFSNLDFASDQRDGATTQSYSSVLPGERFPAGAGAAERNTLGYEQTLLDGVSRKMDSVYRLSFVIPHQAAQIQLNFAGGEDLPEADGSRSWGLDNVKVETLDATEIKRLDTADMRRLWEAIGGHDSLAETDAFWQLAAGGDEVARFLRDRIGRAPVDKQRFAKLLLDLDSDDFPARERATQALKEMGPPIEPLLRDAIAKADSPEVKLRLAAINAAIGATPPKDPQMRRHAIALKLLKTIGCTKHEEGETKTRGWRIDDRRSQKPENVGGAVPSFSSFILPPSSFPRLILPRHAAKRDRNPVPRVDRHDRVVQIDQFLIRELPPHAFEHLIGHVPIGDERDRLGPFQRRPFAIAVERTFAPRRQAVKPLLSLTGGPGVLGVHVDAEGAPIDLRRAKLDQLDQRPLQARAVQVKLQRNQCLVTVGRDGLRVETGLHRRLLSILCRKLLPQGEGL